MHGHWLKGILNEGKPGSGGSGGSDGGSNLLITVDSQEPGDKTFGEIESALTAGRSVYIMFDGEYAYYPVYYCHEPIAGSGYILSFFDFDNKKPVSSSNSGATASDYPDFSGSGR